MIESRFARSHTARPHLLQVLLACACALMVFALAACSPEEATNNEASEGPSESEFVEVAPTEQEEINITVVVDSSVVDNPVSADVTIAVPAGLTAYDALQCTSLGIESTQSALGEYVTSIEGLAEEAYGPTSGWTFTVNGERPNTSASGIVLNEGDIVEWKYVTESTE